MSTAAWTDTTPLLHQFRLQCSNVLSMSKRCILCALCEFRYVCAFALTRHISLSPLHISQRVALDELVLNQHKTLHSQLAVRVARLEAQQVEMVLEREARLAALERESDMENRLTAVEALASSPWRNPLASSAYDDDWVTAADSLSSDIGKGPSPAGSCSSRIKNMTWSVGSSVDESCSSATSASWVAQPARIPAFLDSLPPTPCSESPECTFEFPSPSTHGRSTGRVHLLDGAFLRRAQSTPPL